MKEIYIVTGASGFVGGAICRRLLENNAEVRTLCRSKKTLPNIPGGVKVFSGNVLCPGTLDALFECDEDAGFYFIHAAAKISVTAHDEETRIINIKGTENVINACKKHNAKRLLYISSVDAVYNPKDGSVLKEPEVFEPLKMPNDYSRSKCIASEMVMKEAENGLDAVVVMPSCVIGPGDYKGGFVSFMISTYIKGIPPFSISGGYDFVDVRDVAELVVKALKEAEPGEKYIASGRYASVTDVFNIMADLLGRKKVKAALPAWLLYPAVPLSSIYFRAKGKEPLLTSDSITLLKIGTAFSHEKAARDFGYEPRPLEDTIKDTVDFMRG